MIGIVLDLLLAGLLLGALFFGVRLNARLKALRDSQAGFAAAAMELNGAIGRAEAGLAEMRLASREAEAGLMERVDEARLMLRRLHDIMERAKSSPTSLRVGGQGAGAPADPSPISLTSTAVRPDTPLAQLSPARGANGPSPLVDLKDRLARSRARVDNELFADDDSVPRILERLRAGAGR